jgi:predicted RNA-binding Zn-ribbon protein involved in translation (DUF1610 family)
MYVFVLPRTHIHICPRGPNFILVRDMMCREVLNLFKCSATLEMLRDTNI